MRLVTRSDFDGLACGALLLEAGIIDHWKFAHPKDLQDGLVEINEDDCLANVPYVEGCGLWFDHHSSEHEYLLANTRVRAVSPHPVPGLSMNIMAVQNGSRNLRK